MSSWSAPGATSLAASNSKRTRNAGVLGQRSVPAPPQAHPPVSSLQPPRSDTHSRSMSHPFPSLFSGRKKRSAEPERTPTKTRAMTGLDFADDDLLPPDPARNVHAMSSERATPVLEKDLKTGKCMTCDSKVRWPKDLKVFRCTVCLTINDLQPMKPEAKGKEGPEGHMRLHSGTHPSRPRSSKGNSWRDEEQTSVPLPLSLETTRQLVDRCISSYLLNRLRHEDTTPAPSYLSPPASPGLINSDSLAPPENPEVVFPDSPLVLPRPSRPAPIPTLQTTNDDHRKLMSEGAGQSRSLPHSNSMAAHSWTVRAVQPSVEDNVKNSFPRHTRSHEHSIANDEGASGDAAPRQSGHRQIFKPLEDYLVTSFGSLECVNASFSTAFASRRPTIPPRASSESKRPAFRETRVQPEDEGESFSELDAKTLLLGDFAENGSWWIGSRTRTTPERSRGSRSEHAPSNSDMTNLRSPRIDFAKLNEWYHLVLYPGRLWRRKLDELSSPMLHSLSEHDIVDIEDQIFEAEAHTKGILFKAIESLLKRPGRPLQEPDDMRFVLIILANPLLYPSQSSPPDHNRGASRAKTYRRPSNTMMPPTGEANTTRREGRSPVRNHPDKSTAGQHSGIIKRVLGLLSNLPNECHHHLVSWFSRYSEGQFQRITDLVGSFVTYRLTRQHGKRREAAAVDPTNGLVPNISTGRHNTQAAFHAALGAVTGQSAKKADNKQKPVIYNDDWQIKAAARVMALLFSANNSGFARKSDMRIPMNPEMSSGMRGKAPGQILATSHFYNMLLDYSDLIADFEAWEGRRSKFAFCQYPFFLSIWAKIQIMEHDARRQMEVKAREAFFDSVMTRRTVNQYLVLKVRRECLVEDSLKGVSEVVGGGGEEIKKGLRIEFKGEEGIDAGGLRKEWFLLLVRDVFNPEHGMFTYDEESRYCYFNPNSFETTDQFFLVGIVLGLAIYNSTILDVALPPFAFRKLLAAGPAWTIGAATHAKPSMSYSLDDLAEYRPSLAHGLRQLLEFDGDVEATYCRDFVADIDRYGQITQLPLCPNGENTPVTNTNRREFVDLYVRYLLDTAVTRQFEPFKRGFFSVCGGNALSLFRPEEIELLIRGSDEPLDIASLRAVAVYDNWKTPCPSDTEPVLQWFWDSFTNADPKDQRKLLSFITGSSCIPAMGATSLVLKLSCLGDDSPRFPTARTCFNQLSIWRYASRAKLETKLWRAVQESEGFGLK